MSTALDIGLSLSACRPDIAAGIVPLDEVIGIRTFTAIVSPAGRDTLLATYRQTYWRHDPAGREAIARHRRHHPAETRR